MNDHYKFFIENNPLTIFAKIMKAFRDDSDEQWLGNAKFPEIIQLFQDFLTKSHMLDFEQQSVIHLFMDFNNKDNAIMADWQADLCQNNKEFNSKDLSDI